MKGVMLLGKFVKSQDFKFTVDEFIGSLKEDDQHDWTKAVAKISWNDNPSTLDIRSMNLYDNKMGKGISLSDDEADALVNLLLENDYGSLDVLEKAVKKKKNRFTIGENDNSDKYVIEINYGDD